MAIVRKSRNGQENALAEQPKRRKGSLKPFRIE
jgi:hypothetical protein